MATLKTTYRKDYTKSDGTVPIVVRVTHKAKVRYISTPFSIQPAMFDDKSGRVKPKHPSANKMNLALAAIMQRYYEKLIELSMAVENMEIEEVVAYLKRMNASDVSFTAHMQSRIDFFRKRDRMSYAEMHERAVKKLRQYAGKEDIPFSSIGVSFLKGFEEWLEDQGQGVNSRRICLNCIRTTYLHAIDNDIISADRNPFRKFKIRQEKHRPRPLTKEQFDTLREKAKGEPRMERAVDLFMLSFYLIGINFKDMLLLKKEDLVNGRIEYDRAKTKRHYSVLVEPEAMELIKKYEGEKYLLHYMESKKKTSKDASRADIHHDVISNVNKCLKDLHGGPISTYSARYSWATFAAQLDIPRDTIALALGHGLNTMTDLYIDYDIAKADRANRAVIDYINS
jgi:integrase